jgi:hypothetical protein
MNSPVLSTHLSFISIPQKRLSRPIRSVISPSPTDLSVASRRSSFLSEAGSSTTSCSYYSIPLISAPSVTANSNMAPRNSRHTMAPIVKSGQLSHAHPPAQPSSTVESSCCISSQSVTLALTCNPSSGGKLAVFHRKTRVTKPRATMSGAAATNQPGSNSHAYNSTDPPLRVQKKTWDVVSAHVFELVPSGCVMYRGRERALESVFVKTWTAEKGTLSRLEPLSQSKTEYRFALFGSGCHTSYSRKFSECNGKGTWRKLLGEQYDEKSRGQLPTHTVYMELPEVFGQMVALGVNPSNLVGCLKQGEFGTLRLDFEPRQWTSPEDRGADPGKEWKQGWWVTARQGMGVWIS